MQKLKFLLLGLFLLFFAIPKIAFAETCEECLKRTRSHDSCISVCENNSGGSGKSSGTSSDIFGKIPLPEPLTNFGDVDEGGVGKLLNVIFRTIVAVSGVYALINLMIGGYEFMAAANDPKKVAGAWARIWQTFLGLAVTAGAFVLAAIFGQIIFGDATFILNPPIPTLTP